MSLGKKFEVESKFIELSSFLSFRKYPFCPWRFITDKGSMKRGVFRRFWVLKGIPIAHAQKTGVMFYFPTAFQQKKKSSGPTTNTDFHGLRGIVPWMKGRRKKQEKFACNPLPRATSRIFCGKAKNMSTLSKQLYWVQRTGGLSDAQGTLLHHKAPFLWRWRPSASLPYFSSWQKTLDKDQLVNVVHSQLRVAEGK